VSTRTPAADLGSDSTVPDAATTPTARRPGSRLRWVRKVGWRHAVALAALAFALFPVVWILSASFDPSSSLQGQQLIPDDPTLDNYRTLFDDPNVPYGRWFLNTMMIAGGATLINTILCAMAAYAFSRLRFTGRRTGLLSILLVQMFPQILAIVALFAIMQNIGRVFPAVGLGSQGGLLLIYLGGALGVNTWLMKGFFDSIPRSLDESAKIDGATHFQIFRIIILPLAAPVLAVVALLTFILLINDFLIASVMLNDVEDYTLAVGLYRFIDGRYGANWGPFAAGALLAALPVILLFQFLQRYIVSGLTQGAVKE
jgi:arabinogalactan oligomer / maltooligosaccharide transport system permease protein